MLENIKILDPANMLAVAKKHMAVFIRRVTREGIGAKGNRLPKYSKKYMEMLQADMRNDAGERMPQYRGASLETGADKISRRLFVLTGRTMSNFRFRRYTKNSYELGWDGEAAGIVQENYMRGRDVMSDIPEAEKKTVSGLISEEIKRQLTKQLKPVNIDLKI